MKKSLFIKIAVMLFAVLLFTSCNGNTGDNSGKLDLGGAQTELVKNGVSEYVIVRNKDGADYETDYVVDLQNRIEKITGASLKIVSDTKDEQEKEILIGSARGANADLTGKEYEISYKDGKLVITGADEESLKKAYNIFLEEILGCKWEDTELESAPTIKIPKGLNFKDKVLTREEMLKITQLIEYPEYPEEAVKRDYDYSVKITQGDKSIEIPVYNQVIASNYFATTYNGDQHRRFSEFAFGGDPVTVEVTVNMDFDRAQVMPSSKGIDFKIEGNKIIYTLDKPQTTMVEINENIDSLLVIFAEEPEMESEIPDKDSANVIYFEAGYHKPEGGVINLTTGQTLYLAPGAAVEARVRIFSGADITVCGRGCLVEPSPNRMPVGEAEYMVQLNSVKNITISGIKLLDAHTFNLYCYNVNNSTINGLKVLSNQISTDGFTLLGSNTNVKVTNCFWHIGDDIFVYSANLTDVLVEDCIVGSGYGVFTPTVYKSGGDTYFKNIDIFRCGRLIKVINRIPNPSAVTYMENIYCEDVPACVNIIDYMCEPGGSTRSFYLRNVAINNLTSGVVSADVGLTGMDLTVENVWVDGKQLDGKTDINIGKIPYGNKLTYAGNFDKEAAKVGIRNVKTVDKQVAEKIYIADLKVETPIPSFEENGTRYVPVKEILKNLDFTDIKLDGKKFTFSYKDEKYELEADKKGNLSAAPVIKDGEFCVPLDFFKTVLGNEATYDAAKKCVNITNIARSGNLLRNPDMEDGMTTDWVTRWFTPMYLSTDAQSGSYAMRIYAAPGTSASGSQNGIYQDVADVIRRYGRGTYKLTVWVKKAGSDCDSTCLYIGMSQGYDPGAFKKKITLTDQWQKVEYTYAYRELPQNLSVMYYFVGYADGSAKNILIDNMSLEKVD